MREKDYHVFMCFLYSIHKIFLSFYISDIHSKILLFIHGMTSQLKNVIRLETKWIHVKNSTILLPGIFMCTTLSYQYLRLILATKAANIIATLFMECWCIVVLRNHFFNLSYKHMCVIPGDMVHWVFFVVATLSIS